MLKLRNAVLTALLAFCLAMPFVSCSFNDGATGDVSNLVKEQTGNNQNGGNGGSTGGSGTNSGEDEDHDHDNNGENVDNGGNKNPSGGDNGGSGENKNPATDEGTTYVVKYNGDIIEESLPGWMWSYGVKKVNLKEGDDYTMNENVITLTDSGYQKALPLLKDSGDDGEHGVIPPVTDEPVTDEPVTDVPVPDVPVPDVPGDVEGTMYAVTVEGTPLMDNGEAFVIYADELDYYMSILSAEDYTISGTTIDLTSDGYAKVLAAMSGAGAGEEVL